MFVEMSCLKCFLTFQKSSPCVIPMCLAAAKHFSSIFCVKCSTNNVVFFHVLDEELSILFKNICDLEILLILFGVVHRGEVVKLCNIDVG